MSPKNLYMFQGQEHQPELGWDQYKWRNADPALGRFFNIDPLAEDYLYNSPYAFSENKVVAHVELEGLEAQSINPDGTYNPGGDNVTYNMPAEAELLHEGPKKGDDPDADRNAEEFAQFIFDYTLLDELNMLYTGETADGEEAGGQDYFEAGINFILAGAGGKGKSAKSVDQASDLPVIKQGTPEWDKAVSDISNLNKAKANVRVETSADAKELLKSSRGNMNRYKQYSKDNGVVYKKGYEVHNQSNPRELGAGNDLQHIKWKDGKAGGHIFYKKPN